MYSTSIRQYKRKNGTYKSLTTNKLAVCSWKQRLDFCSPMPGDAQKSQKGQERFSASD